MIRILLVEDHAIFRNALALLLGYEPDIEVVAQAGSLADGDGRELIDELRRSSPGVSVLVLSAIIMAEDFEDVRRSGADAVLTKVEAPLIIVEEIRRLAGG
jgi:DNA-binding NarL/FixJ family response regulator